MHRRVAIAISALVVAIGGLLSVLVITRDSSSATSPATQTHFQPRLPNRIDEILDGTLAPDAEAISTSLGEAQKLVGRELLIPKSSLASEDCLIQVWAVPREGGVVETVFSTRIAVDLIYRTIPVDYEALARQMGPELASVTTINGLPALVIVADGAGYGNVGSVSMLIGQSQAIVYGFRSADELIEIAASLQPLDSASTPVPCK